MNLHIGDPCVFCAVAHDDVSSGECPRNMIREPRLEELYADPRAAMILKGEIRLLIAAYRLLRDGDLTNRRFIPGPFIPHDESERGSSSLCNCSRLPNEHELCECYLLAESEREESINNGQFGVGA